MPFDSAIPLIPQDYGGRSKIVWDFEWEILVETLKEPGGLERLRLALQDDEPLEHNEFETKTEKARVRKLDNQKPKEIIP